MRTLILLALITGWHDAEECRIEAEQLWRMAHMQYSSPTFDEEEALTELRTQLDALKVAQDYELLGGPPGWMLGEEDLDASTAGLEDDGEDPDGSPSDMEVEEAVQAEGVGEPRSDLDMALPVAPATTTASDTELDTELDTTSRGAGVLTHLPSSDVDSLLDMVCPSSSRSPLFTDFLPQPHRPARHTRDA